MFETEVFQVQLAFVYSNSAITIDKVQSMFKVSNRSTRNRSDVLIVDFENVNAGMNTLLP